MFLAVCLPAPYSGGAAPPLRGRPRVLFFRRPGGGAIVGTESNRGLALCLTSVGSEGRPHRGIVQLASARMLHRGSIHGPPLFVFFVRFLAQWGLLVPQSTLRSTTKGAVARPGPPCAWAVAATGRHAGLRYPAVWGHHGRGPPGFAGRLSQGGPGPRARSPVRRGERSPTRMTCTGVSVLASFVVALCCGRLV